MDKKNWAIIDDDSIFHLTTRILIESHNIHKNILVFKNGKEAIDYIKDHKGNSDSLPDIILLDLNMPVMDGWDFLEEFLPIKDDCSKEIIIYIVSSSVDQNDIERAEKISAVKKYIVKPVDRYKLGKIIEDLKAA
jgi:CheY-like chemotaxis protein